jgi:hypothetical protein
MPTVRTVTAGALSVIRRGRRVAWCPEWMNLGNLLYVGEWPFQARRAGEPRLALLHQARTDAVSSFPGLRELFIDRSDVRFTDRRVMPWSGQEQPGSEYYDPPRLSEYITDVLLPGSPISTRPSDIDDDVLVVNVRRGDYFSVPQHRAAFGIDTVRYTTTAVEIAVQEGGAPRRIVVVSDDIEWCRSHLETLDMFAPVTFRNGAVDDDLSAVVHARRLVIPNSTFSYWGGYIGDALAPGRQVVAPWFFTRTTNGGRAWQLRPEWRRVDEIPGGWAEPEA